MEKIVISSGISYYKTTVLSIEGVQMNIANSEAPSELIAKTCGCKEKRKKVTYSFVNTYHNLCKDKKDIIVSEIQACETLRNYTRDELDMKAIETEIAELKMTLDLLP